MGRWFTRLLLVLLLAVLLPALALLGVLGTERGTRWLLTEALTRTADEWSLGATRGDLLSSLHLQALRWRAGETTLELGEASLVWQPASLLAGLLHIEQVRVIGLHFSQPAPPGDVEPDPQSSGAPPSLPEMPVRVRIDALHVEDVRTTSGESVFELDSADLATRIEGSRVFVQTLSARAPQWRVSASGEVDGVAPYPFTARVEWQAKLPEIGELAGAGDVEGDMQRLQFTHRVATPFAIDLEGEVDIAGLASRARVTVAWSELRIPVAGEEWRSFAGTLDFAGGIDDLELRVDTDVSGPGLDLDAVSVSVTGGARAEAPYDLDLVFAWETALGAEPAAVAGATLAGNGSVGGNLDLLRVDHALSAPFTLTSGADIGLARDPMTLTLEGDWRGLRWPLGGDAEYASESGRYEVHGDLQHLDFHIAAAVAAVAADVRDGHVDVTGGADLAPPFAFDSRLDWRATLAGDIAAAGAGRFSGDMDAIDIDHGLQQPFTLATRGRVRPASDDELLDIEGEWQDLRWPLTGDLVTVASEHGSYSARGGLARLLTTVEASLGGDALPLQDTSFEIETTLALSDGIAFETRVGWHGMLPDDVAVRGEGNASGDLSAVAFEHHVTAPFAVDTRGTVRLDGETPQLDVSGGWNKARWPLAGPVADYQSQRGQFTLTGTPDDYRLGLDVDLDGVQLPLINASLKATGSSTGADLQPLELRTLDGLAQLSGRVDWLPSLTIDLVLEGSDINPGSEWSEWPGKLGFMLAMRGSVEETVPSIDISALHIDGALRGYPLMLDGSASVVGSTVNVPGLDLRSGDNRLQLSGDVGDTLDIDVKLDAPVLAAFWPGLKGRLDASARVGGTLALPRVDLDLDGRDLGFDDHTANSLALKASLDLAGGDKSSLELRLADAVLAGEPVALLSVSANGGPQDHRATLEADAGSADLSLTVNGGWNGERWLGQLATLEVTPAETGTWRLAEATGIEVGAQTLRLDELCLRQDAASVCAALRKNADDTLDGRFGITALPLSIARPWLPPNLVVRGSIEAEGTIAGTVAAPRATLLVAPPSGELSWTAEGLPPVDVKWRDLRLEASLADDVLDITAGLQLDDLGRIAAILRAAAADPDGDRALSGRLDANIDDLSLVAAFSPRIVNPKGRIAIAAELGGSVAQPAVTGEVSLSDASAQLPDIGLEISDIRLGARSRDGRSVQIDGEMSSGEGILKLAGVASIDPARGFPFTLDIDGDMFEVSRLPIAHVYASPDLRVEHSAEVTRLLGTLSVPRARFRLRQIPVGATAVSKDEVVVQDAAKEKEEGALISADLGLLLGDDVRFIGFGLDARFEGRLQIASAPRKPPLGEGVIELKDATYKAYGQDLDVERGRLLFAGPMDNPGLDIRAVRTAGDVKAGIEVTGTVSRPSARVFSEPSLPDAEAFAYLLTGRPLAGASSSEGSMLGSAALALGLENADILTKNVGRELGLDEVGISGDGDSAGLVLGKYLTPDIFVSYVMGLFDSEDAIKVNYRLTDRISVEGLSGSDKQAVDLLYRFERN